MKKEYKDIDEYIKEQPKNIQKTLTKLRQTISAAAPEATEAIAYQMPTFRLNGNLVHFAAFKDHIGFFPAPSGIEAFLGDLNKYRTGKGTIRFPIDEPLPYDLIKKVVIFRVGENKKK